MSYNIRTTLDVQDNLNIGLNASISGSLTVTGSINGNLNGTATSASYVLNAVSSSRAVSSSFAQTASFALQVSTSISTQNLQHNVLFVDTSGPGFIQVDGGLRYNPNQDLLTTTSSYTLLANTASYVQNAQSASYVLQAVSSSYALTASFAPNYQLTSGTGSMLAPYVLNSSTSSFTTTSSFNSFTSSINNKTGSFATTGSNTFIGNQTITGSLTVSSSNNTQLLIGTNTLFVSSSGNVGIGTSTPSVTLDVVGSIRASSTFFGTTSQINNISTNGADLSIKGTGGITYITMLKDSGSVGIGTITPSASLHISGSSNSALLKIDSPASSNILFVSSSGNVGIGTSTPAVKLDVFGTGQIINMGNGTSTDAYIDFAGNRGKFGFEAATGIRFQGTNTRPIVFALGTWGTGEIARFSTQGFFGLNTTTPSAWLHISGTIASSSLFKIDAPGSASIFEVSGSGVVTINGAIPVTRNVTGYNVTRFTNSASFDNIRVAISSSGNPVASSVSGSVNVFYSAISSVAGSAISSSVNTGAIFTTGSWSVLTSAALGSGGDTITSHIQDQDRGRLYRATFIQTVGPASGSVVIERLI